MDWVRRLHRLTTALLALLVVVVAVAAPDLTWSAAPDMGTAEGTSCSTSLGEDDEDVPSNCEPELEDDREFVEATVLVTLPIRDAVDLERRDELLGAPPVAYLRRATPPPES